MKRIIVLMYHALYDGDEEYQRIDPADRPYAVAVEQFAAQMDLLRRTGVAVVSLAQALTGVLPEHAVLLTFDDGHVSNYRHALPLLCERGMSAIFFVTSDFMGQRRDFCSWAQLAEMAQQGMAIEAHGQTHRFFDDLSNTESSSELVAAKTAIERGTRVPVSAISFPGGRFTARDIVLGGAAGYRLFFTSEVGANSAAMFASGAPIRRIAIRQTTDLAAFQRFAGADTRTLLRASAIAGVKRIVRRLIGNRFYQGLYERLSS
ncbi:MAG: polysaccharide deacetylase family protein [Gammaproteobacteria bacterium]|nr:polysaccharide deacetylase family protein [Gammaproteobacteria bacterium]